MLRQCWDWDHVKKRKQQTQAQYNDYDIQNGFGFKLAAANKEGNHLVVGTDFNTGALTYILTDANGKAIKKQETALYSGQGSFSVGASGNDFYVLTSNFHGQFGSSSRIPYQNQPKWGNGLDQDIW